jgi:hypothetical protein
MMMIQVKGRTGLTGFTGFKKRHSTASLNPAKSC